VSIPEFLTKVPEPPPSRFTPEQRARALRSLTRLPDSWSPKFDPRTEGQGVGNILLALKHRVPDEIKETKTAIRALVRHAGAQRRHLDRLKKAQALSEDAA